MLSISVSFLVSTFESLLGFGEFSPFCRPFFKQAREREVKLRQGRLRSLIGWLSFPLVPNMVLSKMNTHEIRTKRTYESYTFQPLMSFWSNIKVLQIKQNHIVRILFFSTLYGKNTENLLIIYMNFKH